MKTRRRALEREGRRRARREMLGERRGPEPQHPTAGAASNDGARQRRDLATVYFPRCPARPEEGGGGLGDLSRTRSSEACPQPGR